MSSMSFHPNINAVSKPTPTTTKLLSQNLFVKPVIKTSIFVNPRSSCTRQLKFKVSSSYTAVDPILRKQVPADDSDFNSSPGKEKLGVVVKPNEKPRLVLKFIWMQNVIGIALDQKIPAHGTIPLSPYYFWPRKDAWEELKALLESKPWISQMERINLLNQATDIINLWQNGGGNL